MKVLEETATRSAAKGLAKILAVIIILAVALFGDVMYIIEMSKAFSKDPMLLMFCYLGAIVGFLAVGYLLLGKAVAFEPGAQMIAAWIVFAAELLIIALNIILVFSKNPTGFMAAWAFVSPATPVAHLFGVSMLFFLDPAHIEKQRDKELASKKRQMQREHEILMEQARMTVKRKQMEYTVMNLETAVNSEESQARIAQHAESLNDNLLIELTGRSMPKDSERSTSASYSDRYYGRR